MYFSETASALTWSMLLKPTYEGWQFSLCWNLEHYNLKKFSVFDTSKLPFTLFVLRYLQHFPLLLLHLLKHRFFHNIYLKFQVTRVVGLYSPFRSSRISQWNSSRPNLWVDWWWYNLWVISTTAYIPLNNLDAPCLLGRIFTIGYCMHLTSLLYLKSQTFRHNFYHCVLRKLYVSFRGNLPCNLYSACHSSLCRCNLNCYLTVWVR